MIIAIESATEVCSVAARLGDDTVLEMSARGRGIHSEQLFTDLEKIFEQAGSRDISSCYCSAGPGSYTGLRVGLSAAQGLIFGTDAKLFAVNTLAGIAAGAYRLAGEREFGVHAILDARRKHVYHQRFYFRDGNLAAETEAELCPINEFGQRVKPGYGLAGTGIERLPSKALAAISTVFEKMEDVISSRNLLEIAGMPISGEAEKPRVPVLKQVDASGFEPYYFSPGV